MGGFEVDIVARYKKDYAIGITLDEVNIENPELKNKISFLATRKTKFTNKQVLLFIGISHNLKKKIEYITDTLDDNVRNKIKIQSFSPELNMLTKAKKKKALLN